MDGHNFRFRAPILLSLITLTQVLQSAAAPYPADSPQIARGVAAVITATSTFSEDQPPTPSQALHEPSPADPNGAIIYQIGDGQIQAPGPGHASEGIATASEGTTSCSSSSSSIVARQATMTSLSTGIGTQVYDVATNSFSTSVSDASLTQLTTNAVQSATLPGPTSTSGSVNTALQTSIQTSAQPFLTSVGSSDISIVNPSTLPSPSSTSIIESLFASNIFRPIGTGAPLVPKAAKDHPVPRTGVQPQSRKLQTNKFYSGLYLNEQTSPVFTFPYSVSWAKGGGELESWGLVVSHTEPEQWAKADGKPGKDAGQWGFFGAPVGIQYIVLSASELVTNPGAWWASNKSPGLTTHSQEWGSVKADLYPPGWMTPVITCPLIQGSAYITAEYHWGKPLIQSSVGFKNVTFAGALPNNQTYKYVAFLRNEHKWLIYITPLDPWYEVNRFDLDPKGSSLNGPAWFNGHIQVAKVPRADGAATLHLRDTAVASKDPETVYDESAGTYPIGVNITASVSGKSGSYTLSWTKNGTMDQDLLMFALRHHTDAMSYPDQNGLTSLQLRTTTKGMATAIKGDSWTMTEKDLPINMGFGPWRPSDGHVEDYSPSVKEAIETAGAEDIRQDILGQTNVSSAYYDGKALAKFAATCYALHDIASNDTLALSGLQPLKQAFAHHIDNEQTWPFVYDENWGGVVSNASYVTGNPLEDFGNAYYNDHHFHYGYFVYAAAVIGYLDPDWLGNSTNKDWVNMLVRDYAGSDLDDPYFPFSRAFDWYHGHSWAAGLFDSGDGKNQESSSEDTMASYAIKMWGQVTGDKYMQARGNLMLAIQKRSFADYYLYSDDNTVMPSKFIGNKAAGILFENKVDHTTYFGAEPEYIQGIHMLPLLPFSTYIRDAKFVCEEWAAYFSNVTDGIATKISTVQGGWRGILMANYAMCNTTTAREAYNFFTDDGFDQSFLDGGASKSWYTAFVAALVNGVIL
ncbi:Putative endo-1,3(4)-beta-glucanase, glycosyl hydrolase family 81 [Septoria linicola]|uniref:glucan endo-1,3-beta-D-glucosidase n=1 Tax=Septoria linicola TaxID=215465 RepID=A0A9Q9AUS4_9PEZI|nr:putative endo-1,3(4)-beta-glucanase, glycosyl hydrolase family 81 [Septoria linicola]USW52377.1 Putative endo-1,3(4)-beta-glucanase, glycosyl hydrolase family 81 [Septoria linicola]